MEGIIEKIGRLGGKANMDKVTSALHNAGLKMPSASFLGTHVLVTFFLSIASSSLIWFIVGKWYFSLGALLLTGFLYYIFITSLIGLISDQRASYVEKILPDTLQLMASNLRSGVSPDEALVLSARKEFGFFGDNIKSAGDKISMGMPIEAAFRFIGDGIKSEVLRQTIELIIEGIDSGGELASILEGTADDIRESDVLRREIRSVLLLYASFIFLAVAVISPILYAVSTQLAGILSELSRTASIGFLGGKTQQEVQQLTPSMISSEFLIIFSYINIIITSVFGSLMMALINKGNERYGLKYIPFLLGIALFLFYVGRLVMGNLFGSIRVL